MDQLSGFLQNRFLYALSALAGLFIIGNVAYLDIRALTPKPTSAMPTQKIITTVSTPQGPQQVTQYVLSSDVSCPTSCSALITQATASAKTQPAPSAKTLSPTPAPTQQVVLQPVAQSSPTTSQIALGTGTSNAATWADVPGVQAYIDPSQYGSIKTVVFQASINVPYSPQNVGVRLYNISANHPVWNSDVYLSSSNSSGLLISKPVDLDSGKNLYQVQMQTQLQAPANLVQSSVQITTN